MGRSKRHDKLRCSKCYEKYQWGGEGRMWNWVKVVVRSNDLVLCKCQRCGYEYKSKSKAAFRKVSIDLTSPLPEKGQ